MKYPELGSVHLFSTSLLSIDIETPLNQPGKMASSAIDQEKGTGVDVHNRTATADDYHNQHEKFESAHDAAARGHAATDMCVRTTCTGIDPRPLTFI